jgi:hypothetical protein
VAPETLVTDPDRPTTSPRPLGELRAAIDAIDADILAS